VNDNSDVPDQVSLSTLGWSEFFEEQLELQEARLVYVRMLRFTAPACGQQAGPHHGARRAVACLNRSGPGDEVSRLLRDLIRTPRFALEQAIARRRDRPMLSRPQDTFGTEPPSSASQLAR
jgi:hypothetical protein